MDAGGEEFAVRTEPYRREILAHCYRMLGSVHDAEDLAQETFLRAWRAFERFDERRASLRTWLYRIATNCCLTALEQRERRPLPSHLVGAAEGGPLSAMEHHREVAWLQPIPDALVTGTATDPASIVAARSGVRLALIAALQHLPARQRAVLILREVMAWPAAEVAVALDTTTAAVNSALQRARAHLAQAAPVADDLTEPSEARRRDLLDRYVAAFDNADAGALVTLLRDDVELEMPPVLAWFVGRDAVAAVYESVVFRPGRTWRTAPTRANGGPAFGLYEGDGTGRYLPHSINTLDLDEAGIARIVAFVDPTLHRTFDLPETL